MVSTYKIGQRFRCIKNFTYLITNIDHNNDIITYTWTTPDGLTHTAKTHLTYFHEPNKTGSRWLYTPAGNILYGK